MDTVRLVPTDKDDRIPLLIIQNSSNAAELRHRLAGFTLFLPSGYGMAFWTSLVYSGTRIGGLREKRQQDWESGQLHFPEDWPTTPAETAQSIVDAEMKHKEWLSRPPAKRVSFAKMGNSNPFSATWPSVTFGSRPHLIPQRIAADFIRSFSTGLEADTLLAQSDLRDVTDHRFDAAASQFHRDHPRWHYPLAALETWRSFLMSAVVFPMGKGVAASLSTIHLLSPERSMDLSRLTNNRPCEQPVDIVSILRCAG